MHARMRLRICGKAERAFLILCAKRRVLRPEVADAEDSAQGARGATPPTLAPTGAITQNPWSGPEGPRPTRSTLCL